ncbi:MAG: polysaccharide deacetylase family protein [Clostridia bacterium]|nr:polysaccharide deacetylase family protein [Clostridia bacterium]
MGNKLKKLLKKQVIVNILLILTVCFVGVGAFSGINNKIKTTSTINGAYYLGNPDNGGVSLTFNVYQGTEQVLSILDILKKQGVKVTFFIGGCWADDNGDVLNKILADGHEIGSHGYYHKDHAKLSLKENEQEILFTEQLIVGLTGYKTTLFAPPSGSFSKSTISACETNGYRVIMWSNDTIDWRDQDVNLIKKRALKDLKAGNIVLMHPTSATVTALDDVINSIKASGLKLLTISENLQGI